MSQGHITVPNLDIKSLSKLIREFDRPQAIFEVWGISKDETKQIPSLDKQTSVFNTFFNAFQLNNDNRRKSLKRKSKFEDDEWVYAIAGFLKDVYEKGPAPHQILAVCSAGGIIKGMLSDRTNFYADIYENLNKIVTNSIMNASINKINDEYLFKEWRIACANIASLVEYQNLPLVSEITLTNLILDVLIEDCLCLNLTKEEINSITAESLRERIEKHKKKPTYIYSIRFACTAAALFMSKVNDFNHDALLLKLSNFAKYFYEQCKKVFTRLNIKEEFPQLFLTLLTFIHLIRSKLNLKELMIALDILSHIEFCMDPHSSIHVVYSLTISDSINLCKNYIKGKNIIEYFIHNFLHPVIGNNPKKYNEIIKGLDILSLSRIRFFLHLIDDCIFNFTEDANEKIMEEYILPLCFNLITNPDKTTNIRAHFVFISIFQSTHPIIERIIPYYFKLAIENYPDITTSKILETSIVIIISKLPKDSPLILYILNMLSSKIKKLESFGQAAELLVIQYKLIYAISDVCLPFLLDLIQEYILSKDPSMRESHCQLLYFIISTNNNYERKEEIMRWYLNLLKKLDIKCKL